MESYNNTQSEFKSSKDGLKIFYQKWTPASNKTERVLLVQHGIGEHSNRYNNIIQKLSGTGTSIYALDSRGHGRSQGKRGHVNQFQEFVDDLAQLIEIVKSENSDIPLHLLGHSMGSLISGKYALEPVFQKNLTTLILSAGAFEIQTTIDMEVKKMAGEFLSFIVPAFTLPSGLDINLLSHDKEVVKEYKNDPMVHGMISTQLATNMFKLGDTILKKGSVIKIPVFIFHGGDDRITSPAGSKKLYEKISSEDKQLKIYEGLYHETMNEIGDKKEVVLDNVKDWLLKH